MCNRDQFMEHGAVRLRFRAAGSGPTVLLIHGWALDLDMWSPQFSALTAQYQVIAFDRRGFGQSTGQPSVADDVLDVHYLLGALKVQRAAIVGMSQGARVALRCALRFPKEVACLVLDGPPLESASQDAGSPEEPPIAEYRELAQREGVEAVRAAWARHPLIQLQTSDPQMHAVLRRMIEQYPGRDLLSVTAQYPVVADRLQSLRTPTLVINGEHDSQQRLAAGAAMTQLVRGARRSIIPNAGHLPNLDNPVAYNESLRAVLHTHAGAPARAIAT